MPPVKIVDHYFLRHSDLNLLRAEYHFTWASVKICGLNSIHETLQLCLFVHWFMRRWQVIKKRPLSPEATDNHWQKAVTLYSHRHLPCIKTTHGAASVEACCFMCWWDNGITSRKFSCKSGFISHKVIIWHNTVVCNRHRQVFIIVTKKVLSVRTVLREAAEIQCFCYTHAIQ